ncbi:hypothetical protein BDW69DRAFT_45057 [Aspergillus filifer]
MTFSIYCKSIACAIVPWCGRGKRRHAIDEYSGDTSKSVHYKTTYDEGSLSRRGKYQSRRNKQPHHNHNNSEGVANSYNHSQRINVQEATPTNYYGVYTPENYGGAITAFDFGECRFIYDTEIYSSAPEPVSEPNSEVQHTNEKAIYRRLILDFDEQKTTDAICDEIPQALNIPTKPYRGSEVQLPNGEWEMPVGTVEIYWKVYGGARVYRTHFLVIKDIQFDMLLSRATIKRYTFWNEDAGIKERLQLTGPGRR